MKESSNKASIVAGRPMRASTRLGAWIKAEAKVTKVTINKGKVKGVMVRRTVFCKINLAIQAKSRSEVTPTKSICLLKSNRSAVKGRKNSGKAKKRAARPKEINWSITVINFINIIKIILFVYDPVVNSQIGI